MLPLLSRSRSELSPETNTMRKESKIITGSISLQHPLWGVALTPCSSNIVDRSATWRFTFPLLLNRKDLYESSLKKEAQIEVHHLTQGSRSKPLEGTFSRCS